MEVFNEMKKNFPKIKKFFTEEALLEFAQTPPNELSQYSAGIGTIIKLKLLRPQNILYKKFLQSGVADRDEMAMVIMKEFYQYMQRKI